MIVVCVSGSRSHHQWCTVLRGSFKNVLKTQKIHFEAILYHATSILKVGSSAQIHNEKCIFDRQFWNAHCALCVFRAQRREMESLIWNGGSFFFSSSLLLPLKSLLWDDHELIQQRMNGLWASEATRLAGYSGSSDPRRRYFVRLKLLFPFTFLMSSYLQLGKLEFILTPRLLQRSWNIFTHFFQFSATWNVSALLSFRFLNKEKKQPTWLTSEKVKPTGKKRNVTSQSN